MLTAILLAAASAGPVSPPSIAGGSPVSIGTPHVCAETQYPVSAMQTGTEGQTLLTFTITAEGRVTDVSVQTSSGNADLDTVSVACARDWLYRPAMRDGAPVASPWRAYVQWRIGVTPEYAALDAETGGCMKADTVAMDEYKKSALHAVVRVHFASGAVSDATLVGTSGDADLDSRALACYRNVPAEVTANIPDGDHLFAAILPPDQ